MSPSIAQRFAVQAEACANMGSPFYAELLGHAACAYTDDLAVADLLDRYAHGSRLGLRLGGAVHFRALRGEPAELAAHFPSCGGDGDAARAWSIAAADIRANPHVYASLIERPVQTNEVARAMPVLATVLAVLERTGLPALRLFEIGASAGLILRFDRYRYEGEGWSWGANRSPVVLRNRTHSGVPDHANAAMRIAERRGCDLNPLDASDPIAADTLLSFVWPDQHERFSRLRAALELARSFPVKIDREDGAAWIRRVGLPREGFTTIALHTIITEHMPAHAREALESSIAQLGASATAEAPFARVRLEPGGDEVYEMRATIWPNESELLIARCDGHAQDLRWNASAA